MRLFFSNLLLKDEHLKITLINENINKPTIELKKRKKKEFKLRTLRKNKIVGFNQSHLVALPLETIMTTKKREEERNISFAQLQGLTVLCVNVSHLYP